ncbi:D-alanyl-D-alanine endopeptidase [Candidatus Pelagibacterales bacterium]
MFKIISILTAVLLLLTSSVEAQKTNTANKKRVPISAKSWVIADVNGKIIKGANTNDLRSIASITKLMTAMVVLDANQNLDEKINDISRRQHLRLALIRSNNDSSDLLCEHYPGGYQACVDAMNAKARSLKMRDTSFVDASGLDDDNVSTSSSLIKLVLAAQTYPLIVKSSQTPKMRIKLDEGYYSYKNTNPLVSKKFIVSKTGYIRAAGGCIALLMDTNKGRRVVVILGSKNTHTRIPEVRHLVRNY